MASQKTSYVSSRNFPRVGLCLATLFSRRSGTIREAGGVPMCSRAIAFTSSTALNLLGLRFFFAIVTCCHSLIQMKM